jgi:hypothetical protein
MILVSYDSAVDSAENERSIAAVANHFAIAKMTRSQGSIYPVVRETIQQSLISTAQAKAAHEQSERHDHSESIERVRILTQEHQ